VVPDTAHVLVPQPDAATRGAELHEGDVEAAIWFGDRYQRPRVNIEVTLVVRVGLWFLQQAPVPPGHLGDGHPVRPAIGDL
jgi:hypothetical protein